MLIAFDVDGTISAEGMPETYRGPITEEMLEKLAKRHAISFVSPSPYIPEKFRHLRCAPFGSNEYRWANVDAAMKKTGHTARETAYIDDLEANRIQLEKIGVRALSPHDFIPIMDSIKPGETA